MLGDQLSPELCTLREAEPADTQVVMAEVAREAEYVPHNRHKIAFLFAAMRHFASRLRDAGFVVHYYAYEEGLQSLQEAAARALRASGATELVCCEPGEWRLLQDIRTWQLEAPLTLLEDDRFLASHATFAAWADGRKQLRMEYFYRDMRRQYRLLLDGDGKPEGGRWNFDAENRSGWRSQRSVPPRPEVTVDPATRDVLDMVERLFPDNPGDLSRFYLATTREGAQQQLDWFLEHALPDFGNYQDALAEESPWMFHSLLSAYINAGLLQPLAVCRAVEQRYRDGLCELAAAEGFIRQIIGWREYVRGIYWRAMPEYAQRNALDARRPLPEWFWNADTELRCLQQAIGNSLQLGYAHHIQRLMVIGNFALLAGLDVEQVCRWYLAVYVDAYEWVELPNTLGLALFGDGGLMASKPYAASGKYIQRQGDHCARCRYKPTLTTGPEACPYNSLYWHFLDRNGERLQNNPRMSLALRNGQRKPEQDREAITQWAQRELLRLVPD